jgi:hypothetical protein
MHKPPSPSSPPPRSRIPPARRPHRDAGVCMNYDIELELVPLPTGK